MITDFMIHPQAKYVPFLLRRQPFGELGVHGRRFRPASYTFHAAPAFFLALTTRAIPARSGVTWISLQPSPSNASTRSRML